MRIEAVVSISESLLPSSGTHMDLDRKAEVMFETALGNSNLSAPRKQSNNSLNSNFAIGKLQAG